MTDAIDDALLDRIDDALGPGRGELDRRLAAARRRIADEGRERRATADPLVGAHVGELRGLSGDVSRLVPLAGMDGENGYLNPQHSFDLKLIHGGFDGGPAGIRALKEAARELSRIWRDEKALAGVELACNAVLLAVLDDPELREAALSRASSWLAGIREQVERSGQGLM